MSKNTLLTISEKTGVSISTVSRVLSGKGEKYRISRRTIDLVREVARACNYVPDLVAKGLRTSRTDIIGLTVPNIDNPFFANLSRIVINELKQKGFHVLLADSAESGEEERDALDMFVGRKVDGIIAVPVGSVPEHYERIARTIPVVLIDRYFRNASLPYVSTDNYTGARMAAEYLLGRGHRRILGIQGAVNAISNQERVKGLTDAVRAVPDASFRITGDAFSVENGQRETLAALSGGPAAAWKPDALFAFSSTILLGSLMAIREKGLRIPEDIALISFDNNGFLDYLDPAVTRVEQPLADIGRRATEILSALIDSRRKPASSARDPQVQEVTALPPQELLTPTLIIRNSC